jgi:hypothetical protein
MLSADRIGLGLVVLGGVGAVINVPALALMSLGVLGPTLLRELGWLKDDDDFTRRIAHRAGFHALAVTVALLAVNRLLMRMGSDLPPAFAGDGLYFPLENTIQTGLGVFAISYVLQYWGSRLGAVRVLVGVAVLIVLTGLSNLLISLRFDHASDPAFLLLVVAIAAAIVGLAWLTARRPRIGGAVLLVLLFCALVGLGREIAGLGTMPDHVHSQGMFWGLTTVLLSLLVLFGPVIVALLREGDDGSA